MDCALFVEGSRSGAETHMLISIGAAYLCGVFFVNAVAPDMSEPFYRHPFVWGAAALVALLTSLLRR
jgi:hypothetical protein